MKNKEDMTQEYTDMIQCFEELRETTSSKDKVGILNKHKSNQELYNMCYHAYGGQKYNLSVGQIINTMAPALFCEYTDKYKLLEDLKDRKITGNKAVLIVSDFCSLYKEEGELLKMCLDHDLNCGIAKGICKKVWPDMFQEWSVALSDKLTDKTEKLVNWKSGEWFASRKLDGVRCVCIKAGQDVQFISRSGKPFLTLGKLKESILKIPGDFILDGECCIVDKNGDEDFIGIVSEIKRKNWTIANPCYQVFDCLTKEEFFSGKGDAYLTSRYFREPMRMISRGAIPNVKIVQQNQINSKELFDKLFEESLQKGWEGLMLRKDTFYEGKRTKNMLKVKKFQDAEYTIVGCENKPIKFIENGKQVTIDALSSIDIEHKGNIVSVGSGLTKDQRLWYATRHDDLIGKQVTVKYFMESQDDEGNPSLRFPIVKHIYEDKRDF